MSLTHDIDGRAYVKYDELKPGDKIHVDAGFDCMKPYSHHTVQYDEAVSQFYIPCSHGKHWLIGQCDDERGICIGCYKVED